MSRKTHRRKRRLQVDHPITIDTICVANQDLFALILETGKTMQSFGLPSLEFTSEVLSSTSQHQQLSIIIQSLQSIQHPLEETRGSGEGGAAGVNDLNYFEGEEGRRPGAGARSS